jgi:hypothetical protein
MGCIQGEGRTQGTVNFRILSGRSAWHNWLVEVTSCYLLA